MSTTPNLRVNTIIAHSTTQVNINDNLTVSGNLLVGTTNVLTSLNSKATTTDLNLKAPLDSPPLTGTATAVHLTVSGNLLAGTTNVLTALGEKATTAQLSTLETNLTASVNSVSTSQTSNYYTKTQTDGFLNGKVSSAAPTFTGIASAYSLSVSNNLLVQGTNILNKINDTVAIVNNKANTADVANTYAPQI